MAASVVVFVFVYMYTTLYQVQSQYLPYFWNETYSLPGIYDITGQTRIYHIAYWSAFKDNDANYQYPVIFALHGGGGQASGHSRQTALHIDANPRGYLVVYPEGMAGPTSNTSRTWNAGNCCGAAQAYNSKDAQFLLDILDDIESTQSILSIDRNRVFFTGHSNVKKGGYMSWRMACEYPYNVTAIAPNDGVPGFVDATGCDMPCDPLQPNVTDTTCWNASALNNDCNADQWHSQLPQTYECTMGANTRTVPVLAFYGYQDEHTLYHGGAGHDFLSTTQNNQRPTPPVSYIAVWLSQIAECTDADSYSVNELSAILEDSRVNGVSVASESDTIISYYNRTAIDDSSTCITYSGCDGTITFCVAWNGGHTWSSGHYSLSYCDEQDADYAPYFCGLYTPLVGDIAFSLNNNRMMLEFFDTLSLQSSSSSSEIPSSAASESPVVGGVDCSQECRPCPDGSCQEKDSQCNLLPCKSATLTGIGYMVTALTLSVLLRL